MTQSNQNLIKKPALLRTAVFEQKLFVSGQISVLVLKAKYETAGEMVCYNDTHLNILILYKFLLPKF